MWTHINDPAAYRAACDLARGVYQRAVLDGYHNLSGSSLRGAAKQYGARYAASRAALLHRLRAAGIPVSETTGAHNARILVIG